MCIILIGKITKEQHENAKFSNPDGFSLFTEKLGLIKAPNEKQVKSALNTFGVWHYRIATSGEVNELNIHPFKVCGGDYLLYHNGVLGKGLGKYSDTHALARTLYDLPLSTIDSILNSLSDNNRLLLVNAKNVYDMKFYGKWLCEEGIVMSTRLYPKVYTYPSYGGYKYYDNYDWDYHNLKIKNITKEAKKSVKKQETTKFNDSPCELCIGQDCRTCDYFKSIIDAE